jgi:glycosyltransferase involved in cell wall biosynthesis
VNGLKVPMGDAAAWAGAMSQLMHDPAACAVMARAGLERLKNNYNKQNWLQQITDIYRVAMERKRGV